MQIVNWLKLFWGKLSFSEKAWFIAFTVTISILIIGKLSKPIKIEKEKNTTVDQTNKSENVYSYTYDIIGSENYGNTDNYYFLLTMEDKSESKIEMALKEIKIKVCERKCNIYAFDDKKAFELDRQMEDEIKQVPLSTDYYKDKIEKIEAKYYITIADHFIGSLSSISENDDFVYYPYRQDLRYKELGGKY